VWACGQKAVEVVVAVDLPTIWSRRSAHAVVDGPADAQLFAHLVEGQQSLRRPSRASRSRKADLVRAAL
jgi:hypothetical protein